MKGILLAVVITIIATGFLSFESFSSVDNQGDIINNAASGANSTDSGWAWLTKALPQLSSALTLVGVVFAAVLTFWSAKRNAYMTLIVSERAKWLNEIRNNVAELLSLLSKEYVKTVVHGINQGSKLEGDREARPDLDEAFIQNAEFLIAKINLQLLSDSNCPQTAKLSDALNKLVTECVRYRGSQYRFIEKEVFDLTRFILRREWSRIDIEVRGVFISWLTGRALKHDNKYGKQDI